MIEFVSYDGGYPNLCRGTLIIKYNRKEYKIKGCLSSGGSIERNVDWDMWATQGKWEVDPDYLPKELKKSVSIFKEIERIVNENIEHGCCGGCI